MRHTATLLGNGKVLVAGGLSSSGILASAELYDPATGMWSGTGALTTARAVHTATLLPNGKVLVAGGFNSSGFLAQRGTVRSGYRDVERHRRPRHRTTQSHGDVAAQRQGAGGREDLTAAPVSLARNCTIRPRGCGAATGALGTARDGHTATLLPNGKVLVAGGLDNSGSYLASAELYDPATGMWSGTGALGTGRDRHTATLLPNGKVLVAGGENSGSYLASAELYDPATGMWSGTGSLTNARD